MTLSLDDVRNKRFRLARKSGYEVAEVDDFLDQVQESFAQLIEENDTLKQQAGSLVGDGTAAPVPVGAAAPSAPREPAEPETIVVSTSAEASAAVVRLVQMSTEHAEQLVREAGAEAERIRAEADSAAEQLSTSSRAEADRVQAEARQQAERLQADAQARAEQLDAETRQHRQKLFGDLEAERSSLASSVENLRRFEQSFRANLSDHLRRQLEVLESGSAEPSEVPELGSPSASSSGEPASPASSAASGQFEGAADEGEIETDPDATIQVADTPRLNALLGDQH